MFRKTATILICLTFLFPEWIQAQKHDAVGFLESTTERLIQRFGEQHLQEQPNRFVITLVDPSDEVNVFFEKKWQGYFRQRFPDYVTTEKLPAQNDTTTFLNLSLNVLNWQVEFEYEKLSQQIIRQGSLTTFMKLVQFPSGNILWQGDFRQTNSDTLSLASLNLLKTAEALGPENKKSGNGSIVEPILITGVTGIIVYLFYALRSR